MGWNGLWMVPSRFPALGKHKAAKEHETGVLQDAVGLCERAPDCGACLWTTSGVFSSSQPSSRHSQEFLQEAFIHFTTIDLRLKCFLEPTLASRLSRISHTVTALGHRSLIWVVHTVSNQPSHRSCGPFSTQTLRCSRSHSLTVISISHIFFSHPQQSTAVSTSSHPGRSTAHQTPISAQLGSLPLSA